MAAPTYHGVVKAGTVVLDPGEKPLADSTEVLVTPLEPERGTPAAVLAAMDAEPKVPGAWVDELELLIAQGQRPPCQEDPFGDERGRLETR